MSARACGCVIIASCPVFSVKTVPPSLRIFSPKAPKPNCVQWIKLRGSVLAFFEHSFQYLFFYPFDSEVYHHHQYPGGTGKPPRARIPAMPPTWVRAWTRPALSASPACCCPQGNITSLSRSLSESPLTTSSTCASSVSIVATSSPAEVGRASLGGQP